MVDNKLNPEQTMWIFSMVKDFTDKYIAMIPLSDEQWMMAHKDIEQLINTSRNDKLIMRLLIDVMQYLEGM